MTDQSPKHIASPDDLSYQLAYDAHRWSSHTPEVRAKQDQQGYADAVNGFHADMLEMAKTEEQQRILSEEIERYRQGYLQHYGALLQAESRTASPMITGPANFPAERNRKRMATADNRRSEFLEWEKRARAAVERKVLDARPEEVKQDAQWQSLKREIESSLQTIEGVDAGREPWNRSAFVNSIAGKVERLANAGEVDLVDKALALVTSYNEAHDKPAISSRHGFWKLGEVVREKAKAHDAALDKEPETIAEGEGVEIVVNPQADRVQIVFAAKPSIEMIGKLKAEAWKWAPSEGAWQRKITEAAKASAKRITGLS